MQLLPLDEPRRADSRVALAFLSYAAVKPAVAAALREDSARMHAFVAGQIRAAQAAGETRPGIDPSHAATALLAVVEGLAVYVLGEHYTPDTAIAALDVHLNMLFAPSRA